MAMALRAVFAVTVPAPPSPTMAAALIVVLAVTVLAKAGKAPPTKATAFMIVNTVLLVVLKLLKPVEQPGAVQIHT